MGNVGDDRAGFRLHGISVKGAAGVFVMVGAMLVLLLGVPPLRWVLVAALVGGIAVGVGLLAHRRNSL